MSEWYLGVVSILVTTELAVLAYLAWKVRRLHESVLGLPTSSAQQLFNEYRQVEDLIALYAEIQPRSGLGRTRSWAGSPDFLLALARQVRDQKPLLVVECGSGTSTVVVARCLELNGAGKVVSVDHDPEYAEETRKALARHGLLAWAEVRIAPLVQGTFGQVRQPWYDSDAFPASAIDLVIIDGPPAESSPDARFPAGPFFQPRMSKGAVLILDDADRESERRCIERWAAMYPLASCVRIPTEKGAVLWRPTGQ